MKKNTPFLIIGFGSMGKKHHAQLVSLGYTNVDIYDPAVQTARRVPKLDATALKRYEVVFIANPTNKHLSTALLCAHAGCHLFIEKPLSSSLKGVPELLWVAKQKKLVTMVACNLRFDPCLMKIKQLLEKKHLGHVYAMHLEYGRYLPYQRPGVDYRGVYAARKSMGGGIILDDIHEFDLLFWLNDFSPAVRSQFLFDRLSNLEINVEDISVAAFQFRNRVIGSVRSDYLQQYKHRTLKIIGEKGNLTWDFREGAVWFETYNKGEKRKKLLSARSSSERMYADEIRYFLRCVEKGEETFNSIARAESVLHSILTR